MPKTLAVSSGKLVPQRNDVEVDLSQSDDDVTDDVWVSSEDIFTAMSSPYYQSAAEDEEELNGMKSKFDAVVVAGKISLIMLCG